MLTKILKAVMFVLIVGFGFSSSEGFAATNNIAPIVVEEQKDNGGIETYGTGVCQYSCCISLFSEINNPSSKNNTNNALRLFPC